MWAWIALAAACSVLAANPSSNPEQVLTIKHCAFDAKNLVVRLSWTADSTVFHEELFAGITATYTAGDTAPPEATFRCVTLSGDTVFSIPNVVFDTSYTISLWTNRQGAWITPNSLSSSVIRIASSYKQPISYFSPSSSDTLKALENRVLLWKGQGYPAGILAHDDTIASFSEPDSLLSGYISCDRGIRFLNPTPSPAFYIALTIDSSITKRSIKNFRLYKDSSRVLRLQRGAIVDSVNKRIYCKITDENFPFVVLEDSIRPIVRVTSDTSQCIDSLPLTDTVTVTDNGVNCSWKFFCAPGADSFSSPVSTGTIDEHSGVVTCPIPAWGARAAGMRAYLTVSDGTFSDTINLSRRAIRTGADAVTTPANFIFPIAATAQPDRPEIRSCLAPLFSEAGNVYDKSKFRIYKWSPNPSGTAGTGSWIEYAIGNEADFQCKPGALMWLITAKPANIDFGKSSTLSLKTPCTLTLAPHNWTDIAIPFGFDIPVAALIDASGPAAENIIIYRWIPDIPNRTYSAKMVYGSKSITGDSVSDTLFSGLGNGYALYNPHDSIVNLRIPPIPLSLWNRSTGTSFFKRKPDRGFCVKVSAYTGSSERGSVYCGLSSERSDTLFVPSPPSFLPPLVRIRHPRSGSAAIALFPALGKSPAVYPLELYNENNSPLPVTIRASIFKAGSGIEFCLVKNQQGVYSRLSDDCTITVDAGGHADILAVTGAPQQIASYFEDLKKTPGNAPAAIACTIKNGWLLITFKNVSTDESCRFVVYNALGKCLENSLVAAVSKREGNAKSIALKLPSGVYIIKTSFSTQRGAPWATQRIVIPK